MPNQAFPCIYRSVLVSVGLLTLWSTANTAQAGIDGGKIELDKIVHGCLLNIDGSPCAGAIVESIMVSRGARAVCQYHTDQAGRFTVRFCDSRLTLKEADSTSTLGWGSYHFIAEPGPDDAGAVSEEICHLSPQEGPASVDQNFVNEWGGIRLTGDQPLEITMRRKPGIVVEGMVVDPAGRPVPQTTVTLYHDLHAGTHTGRGGEIFRQQILTDAQGHYRFKKVYPAIFYLDTEPRYAKDSSRPVVWLRTRVGEAGMWRNDRIDEININAGDQKIRVDIGLVPREQFVYHGIVTDQAGRPLEGASISFGYSHHKDIRTFSDDHSFLNATTSSDGRWEIRSDTPWVRFIRADKDGYASQTLAIEKEDGIPDEGLILTPGQHD